MKADLRARRVQVFDHRAQPRQLLYDKDCYLAEDDSRRVEWQMVSEHLASRIGPVLGRGPDHQALRERLRAAGADPDAWVPEDHPAPLPDDHDGDVSPVSGAVSDVVSAADPDTTPSAVRR